MQPVALQLTITKSWESRNQQKKTESRGQECNKTSTESMPEEKGHFKVTHQMGQTAYCFTKVSAAVKVSQKSFTVKIENGCYRICW
jgi:hypothetical protein